MLRLQACTTMSPLQHFHAYVSLSYLALSTSIPSLTQFSDPPLPSQLSSLLLYVYRNLLGVGEKTVCHSQLCLPPPFVTCWGLNQGHARQVFHH